MMLTFDTLKAARRLQDEAGFNETQASVLVSTIAQGLGENLATKGDLTREIAAVRGEIAEVRGDIAEVRSDIAALRGEITGEVAALRGEITGDVAALRGEITSVRGEMRALEQRVYVRVGAMVSGAAVFLTAVIGIATAILLNAI